MILRLEIAGRLHQVSAERVESEDQVRVSIDGQALTVNAARVDQRAWSLLLPDGTQHLVSVSGHPAAGFTVHLASGDVPVAVADHDRRRRGGFGGRAVDSGSGPARVLAPMPGKVVRVLAAAGHPVKAGQAIVVVEAMKMENELRAPRSGIVKEVFVTEGASVEGGALLAVVE